MKRILAAWLPNWPVQRLVAERPELAGQALVLYERHARQGCYVKTCSAWAWARGVRPGLPLAEAQALLGPEAAPGKPESEVRDSAKRGAGVALVQRLNNRGSHSPKTPSAPLVAPRQAIHFEPHDVSLDGAALSRLAEWCQQFSPLVGREPAAEPEGLLLDVGGVAHLFGGEEALARQVVAAFRNCGWVVRIVLADTASAAWAVARFTSPGPEAGPALAAGCSYAIAPPGSCAAWERLPIAALRLAERTEVQLARLGLNTLGQLLRLPRASLATRFGSGLLRTLDQFTGAAAEVLVAHSAAPDWQVQWLFETPTTHRETLERVLQLLLARLLQQLLQHQQGLLQLECRLWGARRTLRSFTVGLFRPTVEPQHLLALLKLQLEHLALPEAVEELQLRAAALAPLDRRQAELFARPAPGDPAKLAAFIERLSSRLGRERVVRPQLQAEAQVELAYRCVPLTGGADGRGGENPESPPLRPGPQKLSPTPAGASQPSSRPLLRPLWLCEPPVPLAVSQLTRAGAPAQFAYQGQTHRVARSFGPERIETGWWRGPSSRRDYYRVETESGQRFWLFCNLQDPSWFLHGEFV